MSEKFPTIETEQEKLKKEGEVQLEEVAELEQPIKTIIEKIKDRIENGEYGLIIGDDASGRVPTRILGDFIREISRIKEQRQPNIIFIPGKLSYNWSDPDKLQKQFEDHIAKFGAIPNKRILIITDTVFSGESLQELVRLIKMTGCTPEIATIGREFIGPFGRPKVMADQNLAGVEIISGEFAVTKEREEETGWAHTPKIYQNKKLSGVSKSAGDFKSHRLIDEASTDLERDQIQYSFEQSRKEAKIMTNRLVDWYESQRHNEK